jgi:cell division transport system permease protein
MLEAIKAWMTYHVHAGLISLKGLCRQPLATGMTVLVIAVSLVLPALFWMLADNMSRVAENWQHSGHISIYLKLPLSTTDETAMLERVRETAGVGDATLSSAADGLAELQQQEGMQDVMRYLPDNPLPAVIEVVPALEVNTPEKMEALYSILKSYPNVDDIKLDMQWVNRLHAILNFVNQLAQGLLLLLGTAVILIIGNTMRFTIQKKNEEIKVLKLIGAKDAYIIRPFLYTGVWYGLAGALFAVFIIHLLMMMLSMVVTPLAAAYQMHFALEGLSLRQMALMIFSAIVLGWFGASLSVRRQLAIIEP